MRLSKSKEWWMARATREPEVPMSAGSIGDQPPMAETYLANLRLMTDQELLDEAAGRLMHWEVAHTRADAREIVTAILAGPPESSEIPSITVLRERRS